LSKELAQTVGGKRIAWLLAILAAFAVFAAAGMQWRGAQATVTAASYTLEGPFLAAPPDLAACNAGTGATAGPIAYGTEVWYCVGANADATIVSPVVITFDLPATLTPTGNFQDTAPSANCVVSGNDYVCTLTGVTDASTYFVAVEATALADTTGASVAATIDDPSAQGPQSATNSVTDLDVLVSTLSLSKTRNPADAVSPNANVTMTLTATCVDATSDTDCAGVTLTDVLDGDWASIQSVTPSQGTCGASPSSAVLPAFPSSSFTLLCALGTITQNASATVTIVATTPAQPAAGNPAITITNTVSATQTSGPAPADATMTAITIAAAVVDEPDLDPGLYHVTADGDDLADYRDDPNNLIGFVHQVCLVPTSQSEISYPLDGIIPPAVATGAADDYFWRIVNVSGSTSVTGQAQVELDFPQYENGENLPCVRWYSTGPGEQEVTVVNGLGEVVANWWDSTDAFNDGDPVEAYEPLVKEWNTLVPTAITATQSTVDERGLGNAIPASSNLDGATVERGAIFNPATSEYEGSTTFYENVLGSHQSVGGTVPPTGKALWVDGARVTFTVSGACGAVEIEGSDTLEGADETITAGTTDDDVTVTSIGVPIAFTVNSDNCSSSGNSTTTVTISVDYPTNIGSISPVPPPDETITVRWTTVVPTKHVFLAWAGQRVLLEHDWRLPPGDVFASSDPDFSPNANGVCPWTRAVDIIYIKGSGPGNFVAGLGASLNGSDQATVTLTGDDSQADDPDADAPGRPQDACISRVIFESEDQGQVDVEAFVDDEGVDNQTKIAFVVYYMKINTVKTSLVTSVEKPRHNATGSDYSPGNPWDASTDVAETDWNVSKDLLVRVRVSGWFLNSNPSGRERDASDPTNVLPADRWVMPDDWAALQGGACGFACRPEYDYMFAPNSGKALGRPDGVDANTLTVVAKVVAGVNTTTFVVDDVSQLFAGQTIFVGSSSVSRTIAAIASGNVVVVSSALSAAPAAGTNILIASSVPFEGPLSALDIPGLAAAGFGSAALSDLYPGNVRDTRLGDLALDWWDAPMPPAVVVVDIRGAGFIKQVLKQDVYYIGTANAAGQVYPNPYYYQDIPESPYLPATVAGGGFPWDTWGLDGPGGAGQGAYNFWEPVRVGVNLNGVAGETLTAAQKAELAAIAGSGNYNDPSIARRLVVFSDNHGEAMVTANGDFNLTYDDCVTNTLAGGKHCSLDDVVGKSDISAVADYPDFRGKHFPVSSNKATVQWTWGGYKEVTVEDGEAEQFKYVVFHALDRDGFCRNPGTGAVSLHPVHSAWDDDYTFDKATTGVNDPIETVDFLIDSDEGGIFTAGSLDDDTTTGIEVTKEFATMHTYDIGDANYKGVEFDPIVDGATSECQAWVKVSNSLLGRTNVLVIAHDDEGDIGFDKIVDFTDSIDYTLNFRWSLITWMGADGIAPADALKGEGANAGGTNIFNEVTAVYGWQQDSQEWLAYFPGGEDVPGANDLTGLSLGDAYWIAIKGPASITWTVVTDVN